MNSQVPNTDAPPLYTTRPFHSETPNRIAEAFRKLADQIERGDYGPVADARIILVPNDPRQMIVSLNCPVGVALTDLSWARVLLREVSKLAGNAEELHNAQHQQAASEDDASSGARSEVREEGGDPTEGGE